MLALLLACTAGDTGTPPEETGTPTSPPPPGLLLVVADDFGVDVSAGYADFAGVERAPQPTIEALAARGRVFERAWANPLCSPSRAGLLTGRYAHRHGVGESVSETSPGLSLDERLLPAAIAATGATIPTAAFGKWHLAGTDNGGAEHPNRAGFSHFAGALGGELDDYNRWERTVDGETSTVGTYATTRVVDDARRWIDAQGEPWFALVAFHAPHTPIHAPPAALHDRSDCPEGPVGSDAVPCFRAMIQAMDHELGRLLEGLHPDTTVIFLGDNGTWDEVDQGAWPEGHAKSSLYLGGAWVPLIIAGPEVEPGRSAALVDLVDLFPTSLELLGLSVEAAVDPLRPIDGVSLLPHLRDAAVVHPRAFQLSEWFGSRADRAESGQAIGDGRLKRIRFRSGEERLFDIQVDPGEQSPLDPGGLSEEDSAIWTWLGRELDARPLPTSG